MTTPFPAYDRDTFLEGWAKCLNLPPMEKSQLPFAIAAEIINQKKNFQSAVSVLFGLSFVTHKQYILDCVKHWQAAVADVKDFKATPDYCLQFQNYYVTEVVPYPIDA